MIDIIVGIVGAFIGGFLYSTVTGTPYAADFNITSLLVAVVGALILLFGLRAVRRNA